MQDMQWKNDKVRYENSTVNYIQVQSEISEIRIIEFRTWNNIKENEW